MVLGLIITNLAIARKVELSFDNNLVLLTGETGAGKTIIMNALSIVCGANVTPEVIRSGADYASVEASFSASKIPRTLEVLESKSLYEGEDVLVMARTISKTRGKSIINGHLVSQRDLMEVGRTILDMHGRHEIQSLLDPAVHIRYVDKFGGSELLSLREMLIEEIQKYKELKNAKQELVDQDKKYREEIDFINYEIQEIESANIQVEEEHELQEEEKILSNIKELAEIVSSVEQTLDGGDISVLKGLAQARQSIARGAQLTEKLALIKEQLESLEIDCKEIVRSLASFGSSLIYDPARLELVQQRLGILSKLRLKYRKTIPELLSYLEDLKNRVSTFNSMREKIDSIERQEKELLDKITQHAEKLSELRKQASEELSRRIETQLADLAMENAKFKVSFTYVEDENGINIGDRKVKLLKDGIDMCEFLISANPGEDFKPLAEIASGGELSRVMLAIKYVLAQEDDIPVLAFDEVDSGIGGKTAERVAEKILEISKFRQVICITHLPQIASLPGEHFVVEKVVKDNETFIEARKLNGYERIVEIARMISGSNVTETTINQAKELIGRWT